MIDELIDSSLDTLYKYIICFFFCDLHSFLLRIKWIIQKFTQSRKKQVNEPYSQSCELKHNLISQISIKLEEIN